MSESELLEDFIDNVPTEVFINEMTSVSEYPKVSEFTIASAKIESTNDIPKKHKQRIQTEKGETIMVNLGTSDDKKEIKIGVELDNVEQQELHELLKEYVDMFAWSYADMLGLSTDIVMHEIHTKPECKPIKQKLWKLISEWSLKVKEEVKKQLKVGFIRVVDYPTWLANAVLVPKPNGKVRVCVDYKDVNKACPKYDFPLSNIDMIVDNTAEHRWIRQV